MEPSPGPSPAAPQLLHCWKAESRETAARKTRSPAMLPAAPASEQDATIARGAAGSNEEAQHLGELQCFSALPQKVCLRNRTASLFETRVRNYGHFSFLKKFRSSQPALPASRLCESRGRTKPAFPASVDSAVLLCLRFQLQSLRGRRLCSAFVWGPARRGLHPSLAAPF